MFLFLAWQVGEFWPPGNTTVWGAMKPTGIPAEEDKVFTISNDWKLIRRGGGRILSPAEISSRFISGSDSAGAGKAQGDQLQHILLSTEAEAYTAHTW